MIETRSPFRRRWFEAVLGAALFGCLGGVPLGALAQSAPESCDRWFPHLTCGGGLRFADFSPPMGAPYLFEDPFVTTSVHLHAVWNELPGRSVFRGGDVRVAAAALRLAVTDRLALIATKDGWVDLNPDLNLVDDQKGFMDLGFGVKYALIRSEERRFILTSSVRYEATQGSRDVFNGNGEGTWIAGTSAAWGGTRYKLMGGVAAQLPVDGDAESTVLSYNLQVELPRTLGLSPVVGVNGLHYLDEGRGGTPVELSSGATLPLSAVQAALGTGGFEGNDVLNLGSGGVEGNDVISLTFGLQKKLGSMTVGLAYERPLTRRRDLLKQRVHFSVLYEY